jgi:hypothetical protein
MKSVSIIKHTTALSTTDADKLRERLKGQFAEGLVLLDGRLDYLGTVVLPEPSAAVELIPAPTEAGSGSPFTVGEPRGNQGRYRERVRPGGYPPV